MQIRFTSYSQRIIEILFGKPKPLCVVLTVTSEELAAITVALDHMQSTGDIRDPLVLVAKRVLGDLRGFFLRMGKASS